MRVETLDISRISTTVRRHEALLRYARYLFISNIAIFLWVAIPQLAQVTSLAAARYAVLKRANWDVENDGMFGAPRVTIMTNDQKHGSIERAVRYLGFGRASFMSLQTDDAGRVMPQALEREGH